MGAGAAPVYRPVCDPLSVWAEVGGGVKTLAEGYGYVDVAIRCACAGRWQGVPAIWQLLGLGQAASRAGYVDLGSLREVCGMILMPCDELEADRRNPRLGRIKPALGGVVKP